MNRSPGSNSIASSSFFRLAEGAAPLLLHLDGLRSFVLNWSRPSVWSEVCCETSTRHVCVTEVAVTSFGVLLSFVTSYLCGVTVTLGYHPSSFFFFIIQSSASTSMVVSLTTTGRFCLQHWSLISYVDSRATGGGGALLFGAGTFLDWESLFSTWTTAV